MAKSYYLRQWQFFRRFCAVQYTSPSAVYVAALHRRARPHRRRHGSRGRSYQRHRVHIRSADQRRAYQLGACTFPQASAGWGTITAFGIFDAQTNGNLLYYGKPDGEQNNQLRRPVDVRHQWHHGHRELIPTVAITNQTTLSNAAITRQILNFLYGSPAIARRVEQGSTFSLWAAAGCRLRATPTRRVPSRRARQLARSRSSTPAAGKPALSWQDSGAAAIQL